MKKTIFAILLLFPMISVAQQFDVNTTKGSASFTYADGTEGTLSNVSATIQFDLSKLSAGSITGSVDVSTLDTKNNLRNKHLKSKDFFDVENYPKMTFKSTFISEEKGVYTIKGKLTIKATTKEVTFTAKSKDGKLVFEGFIYGFDFDVAPSKKRDKTGIDILIEIPL